MQSIRCGSHRVTEQIRRFSGASTVIGVEGACLVNMIFMKAKSTVVNIQPAKDDFGLHSRCGYSFFWQIAQLVGLQYYAFLLPKSGWADPVNVPMKRFTSFLEGI